MLNKTIFIVFGAIASGKSSIINYVLPNCENVEFLSADIYKKQFFEESVKTANVLNSKKSYRCADELLFVRVVDLCEQKKNFILEMCPTNRNKLELIKYYAKLYQYQIISFFVGTNDISININRNQARITSGGDYVSDEKVRSRYESSFNSLLEIVCISKKVYFVDNSLPDAPPSVIAIFHGKKFTIYNNKCEWFNKRVKQKFSI